MTSARGKVLERCLVLGCLAAWLVWLRTSPGAAAGPPLAVEELGAVQTARAEAGPEWVDAAGARRLQLVFLYPNADPKPVPPFEIATVDVATGSVHRSAVRTRAPSVGLDVRRSIWGRDGRLYMGTRLPGHLLVWDPQTQEARDLGEPWPGVEVVFSLAAGTDGAVYAGGANRPMALRYDPRAEKLESLGELGLPRSYYPAYLYSIGADDRYVYGASGKIPWYVVAYDRVTRTQTNLLTYDQADFPEIVQYPDAVYAKVLIAAAGGRPARREFFRLRDGRAEPVPALPAAARPLGEARPPAGVEIDPLTEAGASAIRLRLARPAAQGGAPRSVTIPAPAQPMTLSRVAALPDGSVYAAAAPYGPILRYQEKTGAAAVLGTPPGVNIYAMLPSDGKLYFGGYPSASLWVYDPRRPWSASSDRGADASGVRPDSRDANPRRLFYLNGPPFRVHYLRHLARDADGRIYAGAHGLRHRVGGALAVYDPRTGTLGGVGEPELTNYDVAGLTAAAGGRLIAYSSRVVVDPRRPGSTPPEAKLFVFDPSQGRFTREWVPLPGAKSTGVIAPGVGSQIVGVAPATPRPLLYAVDLRSGEVLYRRSLPGALIGEMRPGPDGMLWAIVGPSLVRIDPATGALSEVGALPSHRGDFTFAGPDLYLAGGRSLARVRGVAAAGAGGAAR